MASASTVRRSSPSPMNAEAGATHAAASVPNRSSKRRVRCAPIPETRENAIHAARSTSSGTDPPVVVTRRSPPSACPPVYPFIYTSGRMGTDPLSAVLAGRRAFLVDLDGVIYEGARAIDGAREFFHHLRAYRMPFHLITNNSTRTAADVALHLQRMDMPVSESDVLTSPEATAIHVEQRCGHGACIFVIGEDGLVRTLIAHGFTLTTEPDRADAVVCGLDRRLTYDRLRRASMALRREIGRAHV